MATQGERLDATFSALADPIRRSIVQRLAREHEASVSEIARPFAVSLPAISKHLRVLEDARLIRRRKVGRVSYCRLVPEPMNDVRGWIETHRRYWEAQLDSLERYLDSQKEEEAWPTQPARKDRLTKRASESSARSQRRRSASSKRGRAPRR